MNCHELRSRYEAYVADDLSLSRAAQFDEHLAHCAPCREWFDIQQAVGEALRASAEACLPPDPYFEALYERVAPRLVWFRRWERMTAALWTPIQSLWLSAATPARLARAAAVCALGVWVGLMVAAGTPSPEAQSVKGLGPIEISSAAPMALDSAAESVPNGNPEIDVAVAAPLLDEMPVTFSAARPTEMPEAIDKSVAAAVAPGADSPPVAAAVYQAVGRFREQWLAQLKQMQVLVRQQTLTPVLISPPAPANYRAAPQADLSLVSSTKVAPRVDIGQKLQELSVFEDLQKLKLDLVRSGQTPLIDEVERVEKALSVLSESPNAQQADYGRQMRLCQEAQKAQIKGDHFQAEAKYLEVVRVNPRTRWACLSRYELGNLDYEVRHQFDAARTYYHKCLEEYPADHLSQIQRQRAMDRLQTLEQNKDDGYQPLSLFLAASTSVPAKAAAIYLELAQRYPAAPLARQAVEELTRLATDERFFSAVPCQDIFGEFTKRLRGDPSGPLAPYYQFGVAAILNYRFQDCREAKVQYVRAIEMAQDPDLRTRASEQLSLLTYREAVAGQ